eukprot:1137226-Pelagomonas_calceolata.AAC.1
MEMRLFPQKTSLIYLGMLVDKHMNLKVSEEHAAKDKDVHGILAGMYACQVWGTDYLQEGSEFRSKLQKKHLCSLRRFLGVKSAFTNWPVLRECGQKHLQFYLLRATVDYFNSMLDLTLRHYIKC